MNNLIFPGILSNAELAMTTAKGGHLRRHVCSLHAMHLSVALAFL